MEKLLWSAAESLRTSKKTLGIEASSRIDWRVRSAVPAVVKAVLRRVWMSIR